MKSRLSAPPFKLREASLSANYLGSVFRATAAHTAATSRSRLAEKLIELAGDPDGWASIQCHTLDRGYAQFLGEKLLHCCRKEPPFRAREALRDFAKQLERGKGRVSLRGRFVGYARELAKSVRALESLLPRGRVGNHKQTPQSHSARIVKDVFKAYGEHIPQKGTKAAKARRNAITQSVREKLPTVDYYGRSPEYLVKAGDFGGRDKERAARRFIRKWANVKIADELSP